MTDKRMAALVATKTGKQPQDPATIGPIRGNYRCSDVARNKAKMLVAVLFSLGMDPSLPLTSEQVECPSLPPSRPLSHPLALSLSRAHAEHVTAAGREAPVADGDAIADGGAGSGGRHGRG